MASREPEATQAAPEHYQSLGLSEWRTLIDSVFVHFDFLAPDPARFNGNFARYALGDVELLEIQGTAHSVKRAAKHLVHGETPRTFVTLHEYGECEVRQGETCARPRAGDIFVLRSTRPFDLSFSGAMKVWVISIPAQLLGHELLSSERLVGIPMSGDTGVSAVVWNLVKSVAEHRDGLSSAEARQLGGLVLGALNILASAILDRAGHHLLDARTYQVERIRRYVWENLRDPELSARRVASALGISQRYMNKLFESEGETVGRLILTQRLQGARADLVNPVKRTKPITEIAHDWGFNSVSHFSRVFRQQFDASPRQIRGVAN
ncbi:MAG: helix-turn-helix domain-containing protein [Gammaproteobacteria bacterium]